MECQLFTRPPNRIRLEQRVLRENNVREILTASDSVGELGGDGDVRGRILSRDYCVRKERKRKP